MPPRNRRRGPELDAAIHGAVLALVVEHGPAAVTMEAVAERAGTGKAVLYRRWPDRSALLNDALLAAAVRQIPHADTGSFRGDLLAVLDGLVELFTGPGAAIGPALVAAMTYDPEVARAFRESVITWRKDEMAAMVARGIARGEVRPDVRFEILRELGQAVLWHRALVTGDPVSHELAEQIVDEVLLPFAATSPRTPGHP
jgi:AcrR family transcriptional regulator